MESHKIKSNEMIFYEFKESSMPASLGIPQNYENVLYVSNAGTNAYHSGDKVGIILDESASEITVKYSIAGALPIFWAWKNNSLLLSDSPEYLLRQITGDDSPKADDLDKVGLLESFLFDGPLAQRTLYKNINKMQIGQEIKFSMRVKRLVKSWFWLPSIQTSHSVSSFGDAVTKEHIFALLKNVDLSEDGVLLPITGGLDSRLLAALVERRGKPDIHSYTFQRGLSYESYCAKKVAKKVGSNHAIFNLGKDCYSTFARQSALLSGGIVTGMHTHGIYCCEKMISPKLRKIDRLFGYFGDPLTGAMTDSKEIGNSIRLPEDIFLKYRKSLFSKVVDSYKEKIIEDLSESYGAFLQSGSPAHTYHEFWKIHQRQNNLINHIFSYHRCHHDVTVVTPFVNRNFADYFLSLPLELRFNRAHFKKVAKDIFPEIFGVSSIHYSNKSLIGRLDYGLNFIEKLADKINFKQELILSPFKYEHHEKNLANYLKDEIIYGEKMFSRVFDSESSVISFPSWRKSTIKEYYRLASLGYLL